MALALPPDTPDPAPVSIFPVENAPKIVRAASNQGVLLVSGDGDGLVDLGTIGALDDNNRLILYSGYVREASRRAAQGGHAAGRGPRGDRQQPQARAALGHHQRARSAPPSEPASARSSRTKATSGSRIFPGLDGRLADRGALAGCPGVGVSLRR